MPLLLALAATTAFQDIPALDRAVAAFAGRPIGAEGGPRSAIDPRLRLARCATVALAWRTDAHDAVVASCAGPDWRIFVPVVRAVPVAAPRAIAAAPAPLPAKAPPVIRRGDPVVIEAGSPGFSITREGVAMGDAPAGARLMIRVDPAKPPVQGLALAEGRATLPGWGD